MRKAIFTLAAALIVTAISFPALGYADEKDHDDDSSSSEDVNITHIEIEEIYEDYDGVVIPPVAIKVERIKNPDIYVLPIRPVEDSNTKDLSTSVAGSHSPFTPDLNKKPELIKTNTSRHEPIPVNTIDLSEVTPADEFVSSARVFGGTLAIAAVLLFGLIGANALRAQRKLKSAASKSSNS